MAVTAADDGEGDGKKQSALLRGLTWLKTKIDSMAIANVGRDYIGQPELPWSVELRTAVSELQLEPVLPEDLRPLQPLPFPIRQRRQQTD